MRAVFNIFIPLGPILFSKRLFYCCIETIFPGFLTQSLFQEFRNIRCHPELFQFDEKCRPISVAGCPPDGFSATGQLWGNPLYRWDYHEETGLSIRWGQFLKPALYRIIIVSPCVDHTIMRIKIGQIITGFPGIKSFPEPLSF